MGVAKRHTAFAVVDGVFLSVHDRETPGDDEWQAVIDMVRDRDADIESALIFSDGGGPNAHQRKLYAREVARSKSRPRAVVTASALARGIVTAISWLGPRMKAFSPDELPEALDFLGITQARWAPLLNEVAKFRLQLASTSS
jgi:hypothetical protein